MQRAARGSPLYRECPPALLCVNSRGKREPWVTDRAQAGAWWELSEHRGGFCLSPSHSSPSLSPSTSLLPSFISFFFKFYFSFFFFYFSPPFFETEPRSGVRQSAPGLPSPGEPCVPSGRGSPEGAQAPWCLGLPPEMPARLLGSTLHHQPQSHSARGGVTLGAGLGTLR